MALLPPFLQNLMGYPVLTTGYVLAPRGIGTMVSMFLVGRLMGRVDPRLLILTGLLLVALSLWDMSGFSTMVPTGAIVRTGIVQGLGLGLIFVPLSTLTFATLPAHMRTDATGLFSLMRNLGSSIGISVVMFYLARQSQVHHATLAEGVTPTNPLLRAPALPEAWSIDTPQGLMALDAEVGRQAQTMGYLDDFRLMMLVVLAAVLLLPLLRRPVPPRPA
jgi:DHA2 family multidrug resistance protein